MNISDLFKRPAMGTIKIVTPHGTFTFKDARFQNGAASLMDANWQAVEFCEIVAPQARQSFRPNLRTWWQGELRTMAAQQRLAQGTRNVTEETWHGRGLFGVTVCRWITKVPRRYSQTELKTCLPGVTASLTLKPWVLRPGRVELSIPSLAMFFSLGRGRPHLFLTPFSVWNYPYDGEREWGISVLRINTRSLFMWANPQEEGAKPRFDLFWLGLRPGK